MTDDRRPATGGVSIDSRWIGICEIDYLTREAGCVELVGFRLRQGLRRDKSGPARADFERAG